VFRHACPIAVENCLQNSAVGGGGGLLHGFASEPLLRREMTFLMTSHARDVNLKTHFVSSTFAPVQNFVYIYTCYRHVRQGKYIYVV